MSLENPFKLHTVERVPARFDLNWGALGSIGDKEDGGRFFIPKTT
jgi:hypothetical protein